MQDADCRILRSLIMNSFMVKTAYSFMIDSVPTIYFKVSGNNWVLSFDQKKKNHINLFFRTACGFCILHWLIFILCVHECLFGWILVIAAFDHVNVCFFLMFLKFSVNWVGLSSLQIWSYIIFLDYAVLHMYPPSICTLICS